MKDIGWNNEPLCETSEKGERIFTQDELVPVGLEIGQRILELFGYQKISSIVFRLKSTSIEIDRVVRGEVMPSVELLLAVNKTTGASIDWLMTGKGDKFMKGDEPVAGIGRLRRPPHIQAKRVTHLKQHVR